MDAKIQQKIAPLAGTSPKNRVFGPGMKAPVTPDSETKTDFRELLLNSNREVQLKRDAQANGDLSKAKDYESFLESLSDATRQDSMPKNKLDKNDFLKLFVTQLQQQDPLKPKDGAEMASQLAQFNSLEQMININSSLERLENKTTEGHSIQYPGFIGKDIALSTSKLKLLDGKISEGSYEITTPVNQATLEVRDSSGKIIAKESQGPRSPGVHTLSWNGLNSKGEQVPDGIYSFSLKSTDQGNKEKEIPVVTRTRITGIDLKVTQTPFFTELGKASFNDISRIGEKDSKLHADTAPPPLNQKAPISPVRPDNAQNMKQTPGQNPDPKEAKPETTAPTLTGIKNPEPAPETKSQKSTKPPSTAASGPYFSEIQAPFTQITSPVEPGPASG